MSAKWKLSRKPVSTHCYFSVSGSCWWSGCKLSLISSLVIEHDFCGNTLKYWKTKKEYGIFRAASTWSWMLQPGLFGVNFRYSLVRKKFTIVCFILLFVHGQKTCVSAWSVSPWKCITSVLLKVHLVSGSTNPTENIWGCRLSGTILGLLKWRLWDSSQWAVLTKISMGTLMPSKENLRLFVLFSTLLFYHGHCMEEFLLSGGWWNTWHAILKELLEYYLIKSNRTLT